MPALTYSYSDFTAYTKIKSVEVNAKYNDIKTLLNTTKLDTYNVQLNGLNRNRLATGTANHAVINGADGNLSSEARLAKSRGGTGYDLTTDPLELPEISTPSTPASGFGRVYFKSDGKLYQLNDGGTEAQVGAAGGGVKNYLSGIVTSQSATPNTGNGDIEAGSTTGFSLGNVSLTSALPTGTPTFGSGASVNQTISAVTTDRLAGNYSLSYTNSTATTAGNFVATDAFYIDNEDKAKILQFKFAYQAYANASNANFSGTSSNSYGVAIYDVTNSAWIIPAGVFNLVQNSGSAYCTGTFQTSATGTQYRLCVFNANATSGTQTMYFDDFFVGPQITAAGPAITDFRNDLTFTPNNFGTVTATNYWYRRVGDSMEVVLLFTGGTLAASTASITLPFSIDSAKMASTAAGTIIGSYLSVASSNTFVYGGNTGGVIFYDGSDATKVYFAQRHGTASGVLDKTTASGAGFGNNLPWEVRFTVPISGWSSNTVMSNDTDTRVVAAKAYMVSSYVVSANALVKFDTTQNDTHGAYSTSTGKYTAPVSGYYNVAAGLRLTAGSGNLVLVKNAVTVGATTDSAYIGRVDSADTRVSPSSTIVYLNAGDYIVVCVDSGVTVQGAGAPAGIQSFFNVNRLSGPATIAASDTVSASYYVSANFAASTTVPINFDTKIDDATGAVTPSATVWKFTAPISGRYSILGFGNQSTAAAGFFVYKNGTGYAPLAYSSSANDPFNLVGSIRLLAGDYIDIRPDGAITVKGTSLFSVNTSVVTITRVGNY